MRYLILPISIALLIAAIGFIPARNSFIKSATEKNPTKIIEQTEQIPELPKSTSIVFGGDIMLARSVRTSVEKNFGGDYSKLFDNLTVFRDADIAFANLEGPISENGKNVGSIYSFRFDPKVAPVLTDAGFDVVSFANNHVGDWTKRAFDDTLIHLQNAGIGFAGAGINKQQAGTPYVIEKNGVRYGFIALSDVGPNWLMATDTSSGILIADPKTLPQIVTDAKTWCDFLIVSFHWGTEYKAHNARQTTLAHVAIDNGADMIIGAHPHVEQATEWYKNKFIAYSLGNLIFDQYFSPATMQGLIIRADIDIDHNVTIKKYTMKLNTMYQPESVTERTETLEVLPKE